MCLKFMPYTPAIRVGTATSAAQAARRLVVSFSRSVISDRLTDKAVITMSRSASIDWLMRDRWS